MGAEQTSEETAGVAPSPRSSSVDPGVANSPDLSLDTVARLGELGATGSRDARLALLGLQRGAGNAHVARLLTGQGTAEARPDVTAPAPSLRDTLLAHEHAHEAAVGSAPGVDHGPQLRLMRGVDDRELKLARWADAGLTPLQGRVLARDTGTAKGAKSGSCLSSESDDAVFDAEADDRERHETLDPAQSTWTRHSRSASSRGSTALARVGGTERELLHLQRAPVVRDGAGLL